MKKIALLIVVLGISFSAYSQENTRSKELSRKEKKELRKKEDEQKKKRIIAIVESQKFVFEADQIMDRNGKTYPANSSINFIILDSNKVVFQLGSASMIGVNGVGGITIEGTVSSIKINRNEKNGYYYIIMKVESKLGFYDMQIDISPLGASRAKITTSNHKEIGYSGEIIPLAESRIHQGSTF